MALYHVNPNSGEAGKCSATKGNCPFGGSDEHFTSPEAARAFYEKAQETFASKAKNDLSEIAPKWHGKLSPQVERKIAKRWHADDQFLKEAENLGPTSVEEMLSPPVSAIRSRGSYLVKADELPDYSGSEEYLIALHSRQGGGNRDCWCDDYDQHEDGCLSLNNEILETHPQFVFYEDDDFDNTYTTHYFSTDLTPYDVAQMELRQRKKNQASLIKQKREAIQKGQLPPWAILSDGNEQSQYEMEKARVARGFQKVVDTMNLYHGVEKTLESIRNQEELTEQQMKAIEPLVRSGYDRGSGFFKSYSTFRYSSIELKKAQTRYAEAEALPDGELKEYLLGDRGTGTYNTTEKIGRRKVTVQKKYQRGSLLGKELEQAQREQQNSSKAFNEKIKVLEAKIIEHKKILKEEEENQLKLLQTRRKAWLAGWPGPVREAPEIEETF